MGQSGHIEKTVFVSYRRTNLPWALAIYQYLTHHGYDVFFDYLSIPSGDFEKIIIENIKARAHFLVVLTPSALERCKYSNDWLRREIQTAMEEKRNIVPLMLEGFDFGEAFVRRALTGKLALLNKYNGLKVYSEYFFEAMDKLCKQYLNTALKDIPLPNINSEAQENTEMQKLAASKAPQVEKIELIAQELSEKVYVINHSPSTQAVSQQEITLLLTQESRYQRLGNELYAEKRYDEAEAAFLKVIELDPARASAYNGLGNSLRHMERYDEADAAYRKAIELNPLDDSVYHNFTILLNQQKRYDEVEDILRKLIELVPSKVFAYARLGRLLNQQQRYEEAEAIYQKITEIEPEYVTAYIMIAAINKQMGKGDSKNYTDKARQYVLEVDSYGQACLESVSDNVDLAFEHLHKASRQAGFDPAWAWEDVTLQWLRDDPRFTTIVGARPE